MTPPPLFRVTVLFDEVDGQTRMDMTMTVADAETAAQTRTFIKHANGDSTWDRLAEYLGKRLADEDKFVINRSFEAPQEVVFDMWTQPEHWRAGCRRPAWRCASCTPTSAPAAARCTAWAMAVHHVRPRPLRADPPRRPAGLHPAVLRRARKHQPPSDGAAVPETMRTVVTFHAETPTAPASRSAGRWPATPRRKNWPCSSITAPA
jgi:uncharacterized protein YndB with AHSA1/START domain